MYSVNILNHFLISIFVNLVYIYSEKIDNGAEDETAYDDKEQITLTLPLATDE
jgi:hypothetical protein